jgi:hypothetical protein
MSFFLNDKKKKQEKNEYISNIKKILVRYLLFWVKDLEEPLRLFGL